MYITFTQDPIHTYTYFTWNVYVNNTCHVNLCADLYCMCVCVCVCECCVCMFVCVCACTVYAGFLVDLLLWGEQLIGCNPPPPICSGLKCVYIRFHHNFSYLCSAGHSRFVSMTNLILLFQTESQKASLQHRLISQQCIIVMLQDFMCAKKNL